MNHLKFQKSSYSGHDQNCVEVAHIPTDFRKSSHSGASQDCVEVAGLDSGAVIRDSQHTDADYLVVSRSEWDAFLSAAKAGIL